MLISPKTRFCECLTFWMTPIGLTCFPVFFMSDDVISFLRKI